VGRDVGATLAPVRASGFVLASITGPRLRKAPEIRGHFPTDEAASKLIYPVLRNITPRWRQAPREWKAAMNQFCDPLPGSLPHLRVAYGLIPKIPDTSCPAMTAA